MHIFSFYCSTLHTKHLNTFYFIIYGQIKDEMKTIAKQWKMFIAVRWWKHGKHINERTNEHESFTHTKWTHLFWSIWQNLSNARMTFHLSETNNLVRSYQNLIINIYTVLDKKYITIYLLQNNDLWSFCLQDYSCSKCQWHLLSKYYRIFDSLMQMVVYSIFLFIKNLVA